MSRYRSSFDAHEEDERYRVERQLDLDDEREPRFGRTSSGRRPVRRRRYFSGLRFQLFSPPNGRG